MKEESRKLSILSFALIISYCLCNALDGHCRFDHVIQVFSNTTWKECQSLDTGTHCPSLEKAFDQNNLNNTCVMIVNSTIEILTRKYNFANIHNFTIINTKKFVLKCVQSSGKTNNQNYSIGISFYKSSNITLSGKNQTSIFEFRGCGLTKTSWSSPPVNETSNPMLVTTLYFEDVTNVVLNNLLLSNYFGYGVVMYDTYGIIDILHSSFQNNFVVPYKNIVGFSSGGGIYIEFSGNNTKSFGNSINLQTCYFHQLKTEINNIEDGDDIYKNSYNAFGRGAAFSVYFRNNSKNSNIFITSSRFSNNSALWGGSVYIRFCDYSTNNIVNLHDAYFYNNSAKHAGGGLIIVGSFEKGNLGTNSVNITSSNFSTNVARKGGAMCLWNFNYIYRELHYIEDCIFLNNSAVVGSAIYSLTGSIVIKGLQNNFSENSWKSDWKSTGAIGLYMSHLYVNGTVLIFNNKNTGMLMDHSAIYIKGNLTFLFNSGVNGGAIAIFGHSRINLMQNCSLQFINNSATVKGGALFVVIPGPPIYRTKGIYLQHYDCLFDFYPNVNVFQGNIIFQGNIASSFGDNIFITTLKPCMSQSGIYVWSNFTFINPRLNRSINTIPFTIDYNPNDWKEMSPNIYVRPKLTLLDESKFRVDGSIDVIISSNENKSNPVKVAIGKKRFLVCSEEDINIAFIGPRHNMFTLNISSPLASAPTVILNLFLTNCPFFYEYDETDGKCACVNMARKIDKGIAQCFDNEIYLFLNRWTPEVEYKKNKQTGDQKSYYCPHNYCKQCNENLTGEDCKYQADQQCHKYRNQTSRLCSVCKINYSLRLYDNFCDDCSLNDDDFFTIVLKWISIVLYILFLDFVIIFFITCFNTEGHAGYTIPFVYFYKFSGYFTENLQLDYIPVFISFFQGSFIFNNCYVKGVNNFNKIWFHFGSSILWLVGFKLNHHLFKKIHSLDTYRRSWGCVVFLFYTELLVFLFEALKYIQIGNTSYVYFYAEQSWGEGQHILMLIVALLSLCFLLVVFIISICATVSPTVKHLSNRLDENYPNLSSFLYKISNQLKSCDSRFLLWFKPAAIALRHGFKNDKVEKITKNNRKEAKDCTWFSAMHFLFSTSFLCVATCYDDYERKTILAVICLVFLFLFTTQMPYRDNFTNVFELIVLGDLVIIGVITDAISGIYDNKDGFKYASLCMLVVPLFGLMIKFICFITELINVQCPTWLCGNKDLDVVDLPLCLLETNTVKA